MNVFRKLWHKVARHSRNALFTRWAPLPDGTFEQHCARCEPGWSWPLGLGVIDVDVAEKALGGGNVRGISVLRRLVPRGYNGPVELRDDRWQPLKASGSR